MVKAVSRADLILPKTKQRLSVLPGTVNLSSRLLSSQEDFLLRLSIVPRMMPFQSSVKCQKHIYSFLPGLTFKVLD